MLKLSIITVCYNEPNTQKTCESIINQSWQDFEWIVVDGGSNEETQKIWNKYKHRIDKFISEPDNGVYNAMNKGINLAHGKYLLFMNAGDYFYNNDVLQNTIAVDDSDIDILYGNEYLITGKNKNKISKMPANISKTFLLNKSLRHQSTFIKSNLFQKFGLYNENYKIVSDWEKWLVFYTGGATFKLLLPPVACFNCNGVSGTDSKYIALHYTEREMVLKQYFTPKEVQKSLAKLKQHYTFLERLFSIKNSADKKYKILTIFGIRLKIKKI